MALVYDPDSRLISRRSLWALRLYYFFWMGGAGFISPFLNLFYVSQGLTGSEIGLVAAAGSVTALVAAPVWARMGGSPAAVRRLIQFSLVTSAILYLVLGQQRLFGWIAVVSALRILLSAGQGPLSDALALSVTGGTRAGFGSIRVWGSLGWAIIVLLSGYLIEQSGYIAGFVGVAAAMLVAAVVTQQVGEPGTPDPHAPVLRRSGMGETLRQLKDNPALIGLAVLMLAIGLGNNGVNQFELVYLEQLGASKTIIGVAGMTSAAVELFGMLWADRLVHRRGPHWVLSLSMGMYVFIRAIVLILPSVWTIMAERAMGGVAFSFYTVALVRYISDHAAPGQTATALALFTVTLASLIGIAAGPVGGLAFDYLGPYWLYAIAIAGYAVGWVSLRFAKNSRC